MKGDQVSTLFCHDRLLLLLVGVKFQKYITVCSCLIQLRINIRVKGSKRSNGKSSEHSLTPCSQHKYLFCQGQACWPSADGWQEECVGARPGWKGKQSSSLEPTLVLGKRQPWTWPREVRPSMFVCLLKKSTEKQKYMQRLCLMSCTWVQVRGVKSSGPELV